MNEVKKYLIINLKRNGDIFNMANTIQAIKSKNENALISVLIFEEFKKAALALNEVENIYTIDRKKILTYKKNKIFSDGMAINLFEEQINEVAQKKWDYVFNYSNDRVSTHLTSYLKDNSTKHLGIRFNDYCNVEYSSEWSLLFNDILPELKYAPINFRDAYNRIAGVEQNRVSIPLKTREEYNKTAHLNFSEIRRMESGEGEIKIIGIQVSASHQYKTIPYNELIALIDELYMTPEFFPVLLGAPTDADRTLISTINGEFNNSLVSIEADFFALSSVMINLDALITPDTSIKHVADLLDIPSVELSLGESPIFKQGSVNTKSVIITPNIKDRSFKKKEVESSRELKDLNFRIKYTDIISSLNYILGNSETIESSSLSNGISIYSPIEDELGSRLSLLAGERENEIETQRLMARAYILKRLTGSEDLGIYNEISTYKHAETLEWINSQRDYITESSKALLGTLRAVIQIDGSEKSVVNFVKSLTQLCSFCEVESSLIKIPALRFRARLEALNTSDFRESAKEVEGLLYEYKSDIQHQVETLKSLQDVMRKTNRVSSTTATKVSRNEPTARRV